MKSHVTIHLVDPTLNRPLQSWSFDDPAQITIGRNSDNDIVVTDPYVSRAHALIDIIEGRWQVRSISELKIYSGGQPYRLLDLENGTTFQLGPRGCTLRFDCVSDSNSVQATLMFDENITPVFHLDAAKLEREVSQIATGDYFQKLQDLAKDLRRNRQEDETRHGLPHG